MFKEGFYNYTKYAYPKDSLKPLSCVGENSFGGVALTIIDSLSAFFVFDEPDMFWEALQLLHSHFRHIYINDLTNTSISLFETNIRILGGLTSAYELLNQQFLRNPRATQELYNKSEDDIRSKIKFLLTLAQYYGDLLLQGYATPTGIPVFEVSYDKKKTQQVIQSSKLNCIACGGTLLLEMAKLSQITGNKVYLTSALRSLHQIFKSKDPKTGLVGTYVNVDNRKQDSVTALGGNVDSYYEYLIKSYYLLGDPQLLLMFAESYASIESYHHTSASFQGKKWLLSLHTNGSTRHHEQESLSAFWPSVQTLAGQFDKASQFHETFTEAWRRYGWLPENFFIGYTQLPLYKFYILRPEHIEAAFYIQYNNKSDEIVKMGMSIAKILKEKNAGKCGYFGIKNVINEEREDFMESFFLAETTKYLYMLSQKDSSLLDYFVLNTEAHPLVPVARNTKAELDIQSQYIPNIVRAKNQFTNQDIMEFRDINQIDFYDKHLGQCVNFKTLAIPSDQKQTQVHQSLNKQQYFKSNPIKYFLSGINLNASFTHSKGAITQIQNNEKISNPQIYITQKVFETLGILSNQETLYRFTKLPLDTICEQACSPYYQFVDHYHVQQQDNLNNTQMQNKSLKRFKENYKMLGMMSSQEQQKLLVERRCIACYVTNFVAGLSDRVLQSNQQYNHSRLAYDQLLDNEETRIRNQFHDIQRSFVPKGMKADPVKFSMKSYPNYESYSNHLHKRYEQRLSQIACVLEQNTQQSFQCKRFMALGNSIQDPMDFLNKLNVPAIISQNVGISLPDIEVSLKLNINLGEQWHYNTSNMQYFKAYYGLLQKLQISNSKDMDDASQYIENEILGGQKSSENLGNAQQNIKVQIQEDKLQYLLQQVESGQSFMVENVEGQANKIKEQVQNIIKDLQSQGNVKVEVKGGLQKFLSTINDTLLNQQNQDQQVIQSDNLNTNQIQSPDGDNNNLSKDQENPELNDQNQYSNQNQDKVQTQSKEQNSGKNQSIDIIRQNISIDLYGWVSQYGGNLGSKLDQVELYSKVQECTQQQRKQNVKQVDTLSNETEQQKSKAWADQQQRDQGYVKQSIVWPFTVDYQYIINYYKEIFEVSYTLCAAVQDKNYQQARHELDNIFKLKSQMSPQKRLINEQYSKMDKHLPEALQQYISDETFCLRIHQDQEDLQDYKGEKQNLEQLETAYKELSGNLVLGNPLDGCQKLDGNVTGKYVLLERGRCQFQQKTLVAQDFGAKGVIIINQAFELDPLILLAPGQNLPEPKIPTIVVSQSTGRLLLTLLTLQKYVGTEMINLNIEIGKNQRDQIKTIIYKLEDRFRQSDVYAKDNLSIENERLCDDSKYLRQIKILRFLLAQGQKYLDSNSQTYFKNSGLTSYYNYVGWVNQCTSVTNMNFRQVYILNDQARQLIQNVTNTTLAPSQNTVQGSIMTDIFSDYQLVNYYQEIVYQLKDYLDIQIEFGQSLAESKLSIKEKLIQVDKTQLNLHNFYTADQIQTFLQQNIHEIFRQWQNRQLQNFENSQNNGDFVYLSDIETNIEQFTYLDVILFNNEVQNIFDQGDQQKCANNEIFVLEQTL